ncbi:MAG: hypothetical protein PF450_13760, partial [Bacteroidales bacterium]|nr:hypothetical protein [Bacteroidales bacterium]
MKVINGRTVSYIGSGKWIEAWNRGGQVHRTAEAICKNIAPGWSLPSIEDLTRAARIAPSRTGDYLWSIDWFGTNDSGSAYFAPWIMRLSDGARNYHNRGIFAPCPRPYS